MHTEGNGESTEASVFQEPVSDQTAQTQEEMRAVWITYYEISMKAQKGGDQESFSKKVDEMRSKGRFQYRHRTGAPLFGCFLSV